MRDQDRLAAQWRRTVRLVDEWTAAASAVAAKVRHANTSFLVWDEIHRDAAMLAPADTRVDPRAYVALVECVLAHHNGRRLGDPWIAAVATRNTRHFLRGDLALVALANGTDRHPVWSSTGKGHRLCGYYLDTNRSKLRKNELELIRLPGELVGRQLADPDAEQYLIAYAQDRSAPG